MTEQVNGKIPFRERLKNARLHERLVPVCLRGDLWAEAERIDLALRAIEKDETDDRFVGNPDAKRLADELTAIRAQMAAETEEFVFRALPTIEFNLIVAKHPPRKDNEGDANSGFDRDGFFHELTPRCLVSPEMDAETWAELLAVLSDRQWDELTTGAWMANKGEVSVPFSRAASRVLNYDSESKRQND